MVKVLGNVWKAVQAGCTRITLTKVSLAFFLLSFVHCFAQGIIQSLLFTTDANANDLVSAILHEGKVPLNNLPWRSRHDGHEVLKLCSDIPWTLSIDPCITVFGDGANFTLPSNSSFRREDQTTSDLSTTIRLTVPVNNAGTTVQAESDAAGSFASVIMTQNNRTVVLDTQCTRVLLYPAQVLGFSKKEDIVLLVIQFWLLGLSVYALLSDSIPHVLAVLSMRVLATGWSSYTFWRTKDVERRFQDIVLTSCNYDLFPTYFRTRLAFQIADIALSCTALMFTAYLGWRLVKEYNIHSFKCVGPPAPIVRMHKVFLALFICLHLSIFLMVAALGLWADQLINSAISVIADHKPVYLALVVFTVVTLLPWMMTGSYAARRENKKVMVLFIFIICLYITFWSIMFYSQVYRWIWIQWPFFANLTVASFIGFIACGVFGIICWLNFNKGLAEYLHAEAVLSKSDFQPEVFEHAVEGHAEHRKGKRRPSVMPMLPDLAYEKSPVTSLSFRRDSNWDFSDIKSPPIYMVEMGIGGDPFRKCSV